MRSGNRPLCYLQEEVWPWGHQPVWSEAYPQAVPACLATPGPLDSVQWLPPYALSAC